MQYGTMQPLLSTEPEFGGFRRNEKGYLIYDSGNLSAWMILLISFVLCLIPCCWCIAPFVALSSLCVTSRIVTFNSDDECVEVVRGGYFIQCIKRKKCVIFYRDIKDFSMRMDENTRLHDQQKFIAVIEKKDGEMIDISSPLLRPSTIIDVMRREIKLNV